MPEKIILLEKPVLAIGAPNGSKIVLAYVPGSPDQFVTWFWHSQTEDYALGHYWNASPSNLAHALEDFNKRT